MRGLTEERSALENTPGVRCSNIFQRLHGWPSRLERGKRAVHRWCLYWCSGISRALCIVKS